MLKRIPLDLGVEKRFLTGIIISKEFIQIIQPVFDYIYLQNDFAKTISRWVFAYYDKYKDVPGKHIQDIYQSRRKALDLDESEIIASFLESISDEYAEEKVPFNASYVADEVLDYFKKRELEIVSSNIQVLLEDGKISEAEDQLKGYKHVARITSDWFDPFDRSEIIKSFKEDGNKLFTLHGQLGRLIGPFSRGWFIGVMGPMKRGKTWWLQELCTEAVEENLRVVLFSLEMTKRDISQRIYRRISALGDEDSDKRLIFPVFDCRLNQNGECERPQRTNDRTLLVDERKPIFDPRFTYKVCTWCRENDPTMYQPEYWFESKKGNPDLFEKRPVIKEVSKYKVMYGSNRLRVKSYPRFSANVEDLERDLDILYRQENFAPDVIVVDYADILKPEDSRQLGRDRLDDTWKSLGRMAGERHCLVITASQSNRQSIYKKRVEQDDTAEDIRKLAHVDVMLSLNQTKEEKLNGVMRVGILAHRHRDFNENLVCIVLQNLDIGQVNLDSETLFE